MSRPCYEPSATPFGPAGLPPLEGREYEMKILLAYDGPTNSGAALEEAAAIAKAEGGSVTVLSVATPAQEPSRFATGPRPHAEEDVAIARKRLDELGVQSETKVASGDAAETILDEARAGGYDLLVTGSRGRGAVARLLLGSVSHRVANETPCSMLVVTDEHKVRIEPRS